jgi:hypothetical protein
VLKKLVIFITNKVFKSAISKILPKIEILSPGISTFNSGFENRRDKVPDPGIIGSRDLAIEIISM